MKLAIRIFAFAVVFAGAAAASFSNSTTHVLASHQAVSGAIPIPGCGPTMGCSPSGKQ
jgi:hypothetical protein